MSVPGAEPAYSKQHRGDDSAYASYFAGMDSSMQQKVAYTTAHFPTAGVVADMGSGSGLGTYQLARLHPGLHLVGVDINPVSIGLSREHYQLPNLEFREGDIGAMLFAPGSLDGILDSSVFHHLTSFNGFSVEPVRAALAAQVAQLRPGGVIVIRDFVIGRGPEMVLLDLPDDDGGAGDSIAGLSTAALFEVFARSFRSSVNPDWGVPCARMACERPGFARFKVARRAAAEYVLRKDYRRDWQAELLEEYTYFSQRDFEDEFKKLGLRILSAQEVHNPWIVENRLAGRVFLADLAGRALPFPPTNFVIVGEKVRPGQGVFLREALPRRLETPGFLEMAAYEHVDTKVRYEMVRRPNDTVDLLPWFERDGRLWVVARQGFPRPVLNARSSSPALTGAAVAGFITEPITSAASAASDIEAFLEKRAGIRRDQIRAIGEELQSLPSPGGILERVRTRLVEIEPGFVARESPNPSAFRHAGVLRELDAQQLLRAAQVGGLFDARLECSVYELLRQRGQRPEPWIGAEIVLGEQPFSPGSDEEEVFRPRPRSVWKRVPAAPAAGFLSIREGQFVEEDAEGETLAVGRYEYVLPRTLSSNTIAVIPVVRSSAGVWVGVERRELPAAQELAGSASLLSCPAWRLPRSVTSPGEAQAFVSERLPLDFGVRPLRHRELGGRYFPSPGITPEVVHPFMVELDASSPGSLEWVTLAALLARRRDLLDGHLIALVHRLSHALGAG